MTTEREDVIKLSDVKTLRQLNIVSDRWYHRAGYLKEIWQSATETEERATKAFKAWEPYFAILTALVPIYTQATMQNTQFEPGGVVMGEVHQDEVIINRKKK